MLYHWIKIVFIYTFRPCYGMGQTLTYVMKTARHPLTRRGNGVMKVTVRSYRYSSRLVCASFIAA